MISLCTRTTVLVGLGFYGGYTCFQCGSKSFHTVLVCFRVSFVLDGSRKFLGGSKIVQVGFIGFLGISWVVLDNSVWF